MAEVAARWDRCLAMIKQLAEAAHAENRKANRRDERGTENP
jgi:hypothetical protein